MLHYLSIAAAALCALAMALLASIGAVTETRRWRAAHREPPVPVPAPAPRLPADPRVALNAGDPANAELLKTCPICGMDDAERFTLGVSVSKWHGWNVHDTCLDWLGERPSGAPVPRIAPEGVMAHFPWLTAQGLEAARNAGKPYVLAADARPGDRKLLLLRAPEATSELVTPAGAVYRVEGFGPMDGGYTMVMLTQPVRGGCVAGTALQRLP